MLVIFLYGQSTIYICIIFNVARLLSPSLLGNDSMLEMKSNKYCSDVTSHQGAETLQLYITMTNKEAQMWSAETLTQMLSGITTK